MSRQFHKARPRRRNKEEQMAPASDEVIRMIRSLSKDDREVLDIGGHQLNRRQRRHSQKLLKLGKR